MTDTTDAADTTRWWARLRAAHAELTAIRLGLRAQGVIDPTTENWTRLGVAAELVESATLSLALSPYNTTPTPEEARPGRRAAATGASRGHPAREESTSQTPATPAPVVSGVPPEEWPSPDESRGREIELGHQIAARLDAGDAGGLRAFVLALDEALARVSIPDGRVALLEALAAAVEALAADLRRERAEREAPEADPDTRPGRASGVEP